VIFPLKNEYVLNAGKQREGERHEICKAFGSTVLIGEFVFAKPGDGSR